MRKVILYIAASMDGRIAKTDGSVDWLDHNVDLGTFHIDRFLETVDSILIGRKTYEQSLGFGDWHFQHQETFVFSRSKIKAASAKTSIIKQDVVAFVKELKGKPGKNIWLQGGAQLNAQLLKAGLIDEIMLFVQPVCLGAGIELFEGAALDSEQGFKMQSTKPFKNGSVLLHYERA